MILEPHRKGAQFYNLIGCVKSEQFQKVFIEWVEDVIKSGERIKTIAVDGKKYGI